MRSIFLIGLLLFVVGCYGAVQDVGEQQSETLMSDLECPVCDAAVEYITRKVISQRRQCAKFPEMKFCERGDVAAVEVSNVVANACKEPILNFFPAVTEEDDTDHGVSFPDEFDEEEGKTSGDDSDLVDDDGIARNIPDPNRGELAMDAIPENYRDITKKVCKRVEAFKSRNVREGFIRMLINKASSPDKRKVQKRPEGGDVAATSAYRKDVYIQRMRDYKVVVEMQERVCNKACGTINRGQEPPKLKVWNAYGKYIRQSDYDEL